MTIKQKMLMQKVATVNGLKVDDFGPIDKRTLSSLFYQNWIRTFGNRVKLTTPGIVSLRKANDLSIYINKPSEFTKPKKRKAKLIIIPRRAS